MVKEDIKREACASMMPKTETSGDDAAEEWSISVNWEEDMPSRQKWRRRIPK